MPEFDKTTRTFTEMSPLYKKLGVIKLKYQYWYSIAIFCFEYFHNLEFPNNLQNNFSSRSELQLRSDRTESNDFCYTPQRLVSTYKKPSIYGSAFWNSLALWLLEHGVLYNVHTLQSGGL